MSAAAPAAEPAQPADPAASTAPAAAPVAVVKPVTTARKGFFALDLLDNRYPALHGLRVLAIVSVVQFHVTWIFYGEQGVVLNWDFVEASQRIFFGMDLFFILSGFLIGSILLRSLQLSGTQNLRRFYLRRIFRTFPSYYVVLTVLALCVPLTALQRRHLPWEYLYGTNFLELHRPSVIMFWGWSLALEEQFYLTVPVLFFVLHRLRSDKGRIGLLAALWISALGVRYAIFRHHGRWSDLELYSAVYFRTYTRFDTLVLGILLAFVHSRYGAAIGAWLKHPRHRAMLALPSLSCLWLLLRPGMFGPENVQLVHIFAWGTVTSLMYFPALLLLLHGDGWLHRWLSAPIFRRVATLGYGVYLVHIPIIDHAIVPAARALQARHVTMALVWPGALAAVMLASFAIGYAMHVFIEKPSLWIRERLAG
jgi:peptidoglycan/LPS O-acetylase OafA/YrhL